VEKVEKFENQGQTVPSKIQAEQHERIALTKGTDRLLADIESVKTIQLQMRRFEITDPIKKAELRAEVFKTLAVNLVGTLKLYAHVDHWPHQGIPFSACPHKPCPEARHIIDTAVQIIAEVNLGVENV